MIEKKKDQDRWELQEETPAKAQEYDEEYDGVTHRVTFPQCENSPALISREQIKVELSTRLPGNIVYANNGP